MQELVKMAKGFAWLVDSEIRPDEMEMFREHWARVTDRPIIVMPRTKLVVLEDDSGRIDSDQ